MNKDRRSFLTLLACLPSIGLASGRPNADPAANSAVVAALARLPTPWPGDYSWSSTFRAAPYIEAAAALQALGREQSIRVLGQLCQRVGWGDKTIVHASRDDQAIILCRMLFAKRPGGKFRGPLLGGANLLGDTNYEDWPLEPIELVGDVPFLLTPGYSIEGVAEPASFYFDYCIKHCDGSSVRYKRKHPLELQAALERLQTDARWRRPLNANEIGFLAGQVS